MSTAVGPLAGSWIDAIRVVDRVAARHIGDMRDLFALGQDPPSKPPEGFSALTELNGVATETDPDARVVAGDFRLISVDEDYGSHSVRLLCGDLDLVLGPHYRYETLLFAVSMAVNPAADDVPRDVA